MRLKTIPFKNITIIQSLNTKTLTREDVGQGQAKKGFYLQSCFIISLRVKSMEKGICYVQKDRNLAL